MMLCGGPVREIMVDGARVVIDSNLFSDTGGYAFGKHNNVKRILVRDNIMRHFGYNTEGKSIAQGVGGGIGTNSGWKVDKMHSPVQ